MKRNDARLKDGRAIYKCNNAAAGASGTIPRRVMYDYWIKWRQNWRTRPWRKENFSKFFSPYFSPFYRCLARLRWDTLIFRVPKDSSLVLKRQDRLSDRSYRVAVGTIFAVILFGPASITPAPRARSIFDSRLDRAYLRIGSFLNF